MERKTHLEREENYSLLFETNYIYLTDFNDCLKGVFSILAYRHDYKF